MANTMLPFSDELTAYLRSMSKEHPVLTELREETSKLPHAMMQISKEQGALMATLIRIMGARRTLEVGTFTGYSSLVVALALPDDGEVIACDVSEEWTSMARKAWEKAAMSDRIHLYLQPAVQTLEELLAAGQQGTFDFAFIDADKSNYDQYYESSLKLVRKGGLIAIDNVLWNGAVIDDARQDPDTVAIRNLNQKIIADTRVEPTMAPIGDGLTLAVVL